MVTRTSTTRTMCAQRAQSADLTAATGHAAFSFEELVNAYYDCRKHKRGKTSAIDFEVNLERNLIQLRDELLADTYTIGRSICFVITHPKPREVWAATFRDRIVHHLLYNRIAPRFEAGFIADSCACIKGRGTLYAAQRLESKIRSATENWAKPMFYLKADLANFFVSIDKNILFSLLSKKIIEPWWLELARHVLFHDPRQHYTLHSPKALVERVPVHKRLASQPAHIGLPIGNLSSQFFANVLLNELDQYAKQTLRAKHYIRYVDDFVILGSDPSALHQKVQAIDAFLKEHLAASLNPSKTIIQPVERGIDFVGQVIKPWHRTTRKRTLQHALHQVKNSPIKSLRDTANSYFGLLRQASHSHKSRVKLAKVIFLRGKAVDRKLTKTYGSNG